MPNDYLRAKSVCGNPEYQWATRTSDTKIQAKNITKPLTRKQNAKKGCVIELNGFTPEKFLNICSEIPDQGYHISDLYFQSEDYYISVCRNSP